jgi:gamma-glutamyltranspeptidase/glutathione hydrolase
LRGVLVRIGLSRHRCGRTKIVASSAASVLRAVGAYLGDPAFSDIPLDGLLSDSFAAEHAALIDPDHAGTSRAPPGDPTDDTTQRSTTHLTVVDKDGMIVTYTFTIESTGGNAIVVPGWGFLVNNELTDFDYDKLDHPNSPDGNKRPRSSIAPTIVERDGEPILATGTPGGSTIITPSSDPARALRPRQDAAAGDRCAARGAAQHRADAGRAAVHLLARGRGARERLRALVHDAGADAADRR